MRAHRIAAVVGLVILTGCGGARESRLNPINWFTGERVETLVPRELNEFDDNRPRVAQIMSLRAEQSAGGAIVTAVGLPQAQGFYEAELVPVPSERADVLDLEFRIVPPRSAVRQGTQASREVVVASFLTSQDLAGITTIRVLGTQNARSVRR
ncbi:hypothetical protein [Algirhabdus cladophorae]|uniref:hypothetical protein n=1 Tax=Algirhabdus cladophorae TaxID=3377108 RepID=UPI003B84AA65